MALPKDEVRKMLERLPNDATLEDIQYHIYVREKIERGLQDIKKRKLMSQKEVQARMSKWLGK